MPSIRLPERRRKQRPEPDPRSCPAHRAWVRRHRCSVPYCEREPIECAHVRSGTDGGVALKPSDRWCISLCRDHHAQQHWLGEAAFAKKYRLDLYAIAEAFAALSPHRRKLFGEPLMRAPLGRMAP